MNKIYRATLVVAVFPAALLAATTLSPPRPTDSLSWMAGCWRQERGRVIVEERWSPPRAGMLMGMGRTIHNDTLQEHEFVLIREEQGRVQYEAHPSGQPPNIFPLKSMTEDAVTFEDPAHDFPQRVGYRRAGSDSMIGWIEGTRGTNTRRFEFPYARIRCEG